MNHSPEAFGQFVAWSAAAVTVVVELFLVDFINIKILRKKAPQKFEELFDKNYCGFIFTKSCGNWV